MYAGYLQPSTAEQAAQLSGRSTDAKFYCASSNSTSTHYAWALAESNKQVSHNNYQFSHDVLCMLHSYLTITSFVATPLTCTHTHTLAALHLALSKVLHNASTNHASCSMHMQVLFFAFVCAIKTCLHYEPGWTWLNTVSVQFKLNRTQIELDCLSPHVCTARNSQSGFSYFMQFIVHY